MPDQIRHDDIEPKGDKALGLSDGTGGGFGFQLQFANIFNYGMYTFSIWNCGLRLGRMASRDSETAPGMCRTFFLLTHRQLKEGNEGDAL